jgi:hypothetical protein
MPTTMDFQPLYDLLAATTDDAVTLTFPEVESLIGAPLPEVSFTNMGWWSNGGAWAGERAAAKPGCV